MTQHKTHGIATPAQHSLRGEREPVQPERVPQPGDKLLRIHNEGSNKRYLLTTVVRVNAQSIEAVHSNGIPAMPVSYSGCDHGMTKTDAGTSGHKYLTHERCAMKKRLKAVWLALFPAMDEPEESQLQEWLEDANYTRIVRALFALYDEYQDANCVLSLEAAIAFMKWRLAATRECPEVAEVNYLFDEYMSARGEKVR